MRIKGIEMVCPNCEDCSFIDDCDVRRRLTRLEKRIAYDGETLRQIIRYLRQQFGKGLFRRD